MLLPHKALPAELKDERVWPYLGTGVIYKTYLGIICKTYPTVTFWFRQLTACQAPGRRIVFTDEKADPALRSALFLSQSQVP